jgi:hypothetical protein
VRRGPKGANDGGATELSEGGGKQWHSGVKTARQRLSGQPAWTRVRGKGGGGDGVLGRVLVREDKRGKKRGRRRWGALYRRCGGGGGRAAGGAMRR